MNEPEALASLDKLLPVSEILIGIINNEIKDKHLTLPEVHVLAGIIASYYLGTSLSVIKPNKTDAMFDEWWSQVRGMADDVLAAKRQVIAQFVAEARLKDAERGEGWGVKFNAKSE